MAIRMGGAHLLGMGGDHLVDGERLPEAYDYRSARHQSIYRRLQTSALSW